MICVLAGKLAKGAVLKALCSGFEETTEPAVCLSGGGFYLLVYVSKLDFSMKISYINELLWF